MCQVLLYKKLGREHNVEITLEENDNVVYLKNCTADPLTEFELNLFLHFYYEREVIFLFDGYDEIRSKPRWDYSEVVINCLKNVCSGPRKHTVWITSRPLFDDVETELKEELKLESHYIDFFSGAEYLQKFWEYTLKVDELNEAQLENVKKLLDHMSSHGNRPMQKESINGIFYNAALYLSHKIQNTHIPLWKYDKHYHRLISPDCFDVQMYDIFPLPACSLCYCCWYCKNTCENERCINCPEYKHNISMNLLTLYLAAVDVEHNIKKENGSEEWYLNVETYTVYERFLANKIKKRWQEKNGTNIYIPDVIKTYEKELADSVLMHKKLAAHDIFYKDSEKLFCQRDLAEIGDFLYKLMNGEERSDIIAAVYDDCSFDCYAVFPIFIHQTFAEYFAVEYICDCLKIKNVSERTMLSYFDCLGMRGRVCSGVENVHFIFDKKIAMDRALMTVLENNKFAIFNKLFCRRSWVFNVTLLNLMLFLRDVAECAIGKTEVLRIPEEKKIELVNVLDRILQKMRRHHGRIRQYSESEFDIESEFDEFF
ncbi:hypothetical protein PYW08_012911 [Mythimna loreyi]|uniref:Uncharacterized protein n=1 Tax=Mythimna loreyi TaxID=667449 RepID=A0ACC2Q221_9NEOP|nr:hypothetical protein PYW08_012911 [Mythimna loreyi]